MKLNVEGMTCNHCVKSVTAALTEAGATDVEVSLEGKYASFEPKANTAADVYVEAIENIGFDVK